MVAAPRSEPSLRGPVILVCALLLADQLSKLAALTWLGPTPIPVLGEHLWLQLVHNTDFGTAMARRALQEAGLPEHGFAAIGLALGAFSLLGAPLLLRRVTRLRVRLPVLLGLYLAAAFAGPALLPLLPSLGPSQAMLLQAGGAQAFLLLCFLTTRGPRARLALALLFAGNLGNVIDAAFRPGVVDFLGFELFGWRRVANLADVAITLSLPALVFGAIGDHMRLGGRYGPAGGEK